MRILFLCSGNIHRSALAEVLLRREAARDGRADIEVSSAGTLPLPSMGAAEEAVRIAGEDGLDLSGHRSRPADAEVLLAADLVLVMEADHLRWVDAVCPEAAGWCRMLSEHAGPDIGIAPGEDIPDAIGEDVASFRRTFGILRDCVTRLYRELPPPPEAVYTRAIEERFRLRRRRAVGLSPADYDLMDRWWSRGVPLWIVLETIDRLLGRKESAGDAGRVRRLSYCEEEIERRFASFERARVAPAAGAAPPRPAVAGDFLLRAAAARLREAARRARQAGREAASGILEAAAAELEPAAGAAPRDLPAARLALHAAEEALGEALLRACPERETAALREEAESSLAPHRARMTPAAFDATARRYLIRRIREILEIPDLADPAAG